MLSEVGPKDSCGELPTTETPKKNRFPYIFCSIKTTKIVFFTAHRTFQAPAWNSYAVCYLFLGIKPDLCISLRSSRHSRPIAL